MNHYLDELVQSSQRILLLQGPIGHFFADLSDWLVGQGKTVYKINFNGGDEHFYPLSIENTIAYRGSVSEFYPYLQLFCKQHNIDAMVCFGDNRKYHKIAKKISQDRQILFWVLEEGYFRPDYVTLEKLGVNAFSPLPRQADFYLEQAENLPEPTVPLKLAKGFLTMAKVAIAYYVSAYLARDNYPKYQHHRIINLKYYIKHWIISGIKRTCYYLRDRTFAKKVTKGELGHFFIVPLQVYDDSQVKIHCDFNSVGELLAEVLRSFATSAPNHLNLVIKHHPMDRGFVHYESVILEFESCYPHLKGRLFYVHDVPLPVLLRRGKGMVTLNSTSGISALLHGMPVITLGRANYHFEGLTHQGDLASFWQNPTKPDMSVFEAYRKYHLNKTMINGSFYTRVILPLHQDEN
ncbi:TPA: capsule biosynthesis protein [Haemophilus influenzae]